MLTPVVSCPGLDPSGYRGASAAVQAEEWEGGSSREEKFAGCHLPSVVCPACHVLVAVHETTVSWAAPLLITNQLCALAPVLVCDQQLHVQMCGCWSLVVRSVQSGPLSLMTSD